MIEKSFVEIKSIIDKARYDALRSVNTELVNLYWKIGGFISEQMKNTVWGENTIDQLSEFLNSHGPDYKGFNRRSLYRMKQFYEAYNGNLIVSPLVTQLSWSKHLLILSKTKTMEEKEFYIRLTIRENYSKRELERQLDSGIYERVMLSSNTFLSDRLHVPDVKGYLRDSYIFEFLGLPEDHSENDLQKGLLKNLKLFLLELGRDFIFIGEEFKIQVGNNDYFIDLLFRRFERG